MRTIMNALLGLSVLGGVSARPALRIAGSRVGARASQANTRSSPVPVKAANEGTARSGARAPD